MYILQEKKGTMKKKFVKAGTSYGQIHVFIKHKNEKLGMNS